MVKTFQEMSDAELLECYRENVKSDECDWYDFQGEIKAEALGMILEELDKRGFKF